MQSELKNLPKTLKATKQKQRKVAEDLWEKVKKTYFLNIGITTK